MKTVNSQILQILMKNLEMNKHFIFNRLTNNVLQILSSNRSLNLKNLV